MNDLGTFLYTSEKTDYGVPKNGSGSRLDEPLHVLSSEFLCKDVVEIPSWGWVTCPPCRTGGALRRSRLQVWLLTLTRTELELGPLYGGAGEKIGR